MANLTISIDDRVLRRARMKALEQGTSVNALLRSYLESFTGMDDSRVQAMRELLELSAASGSRSTVPRWTREELHER